MMLEVLYYSLLSTLKDAINIILQVTTAYISVSIIIIRCVIMIPEVLY